MIETHATAPADPDDPSLVALLASDPLEWARRVPLLVYDRHAGPVAARADRRARRLQRDGDPESADAVRLDVVNHLRHACTNYEELVADVAAHYGHGRRDDIIAFIRERSLRALAHRFPAFTNVCRLTARKRAAPPRTLAVNASIGRQGRPGSDE